MLGIGGDWQPGDLHYLLYQVTRLEVASNLNDPYSQAPNTSTRDSNSLSDPYIICVARGSPKLSQEPEMANSPKDF